MTTLWEGGSMSKAEEEDTAEGLPHTMSDNNAKRAEMNGA